MSLSEEENKAIKKERATTLVLSVLLAVCSVAIIVVTLVRIFGCK